MRVYLYKYCKCVLFCHILVSLRYLVAIYGKTVYHKYCHCKNIRPKLIVVVESTFLYHLPCNFHPTPMFSLRCNVAGFGIIVIFYLVIN